MEKFDEILYKGFKTKFYITDKVQSYLKKEGINIDKLKQRSEKDNDNYSFFYEVLLFEKIDEDSDGIPDKKFGKEFKIIYYRVLKKEKKYNKDFEHKILEEFKDKLYGEEIGGGSKEIFLEGDTFLEVKYKILGVK